MGIRYYKPTSPGCRFASVGDFSELTDKNKKPEKRLTAPLKKTGGRNHHGFITCRHRGGGDKRRYRIIDFRRNAPDGVPATVTHIEYDPNRSARIAPIVYPDGVKRYIIAPEGLAAGMTVSSVPDAEPRVGCCLPLARIPTGLQIHNIEMVPGGGAKLCRSAGVSATLTAREGTWAQITLPSGEVRRTATAKLV
jgi:large subunit ribosomal protein L2